MLFLGLGSGLGTALVDDGRVVALELAHLPYQGPDVRGSARPARPRRRSAKRRGARSCSKARSCCAPRWPRNTSCSAAATCGCSTSCPTAFAAATTTRRSKAAFARGISPEPATPAAVAARSARGRSRRASTCAICSRRIPARADRFFLEVGEHLFIDYSKNLITQDSMTALVRAGAQDRRRGAARSDVRRRADQRHRDSARCCTSRCAIARTGRCRSTAAT